MSGESEKKTVKANALEVVAGKIKAGDKVTAEDVERAFLKAKEADRLKYEQLGNNASMYEKFNQVFLEDLEQLKMALIEQIEALEAKKGVERAKILKNTEDLTPDLKRLRDRHSNFMGVASEMYHKTDPKRDGAEMDDYKGSNEEDWGGFGRTGLMGFMTGLELMKKGSSHAVYEQALEAFKNSGKDQWAPSFLEDLYLSDDAVRKIIGEKHLGVLQPFGLNGQSQGLLAAYLASAEESLGDQYNVYEEYLTNQITLFMVGETGTLLRENLTKPKLADDRIVTSMLPLEMILNPKEWLAEKLEMVQTKFRTLKKIAGYLPDADKADFKDLLAISESSITPDKEGEIDRAIPALTIKFREFVKAAPGRYEADLKSSEDKLGELKNEKPSGLNEEQEKGFRERIAEIKTKITALRNHSIADDATFETTETLYVTEFQPVETAIKQLATDIDAAVEENKTKAEEEKRKKEEDDEAKKKDKDKDEEDEEFTEEDDDDESDDDDEKNAPTSKKESSEESESDVITRNWQKGVPENNELSPDETYVAEEGSELRRDNNKVGDGKVSGKIEDEVEVDLKKDSDGALLSALRVQGKYTVITFVRIKLPDGIFAWIDQENLKKKEVSEKDENETPVADKETTPLENAASKLREKYSFGDSSVNLQFVEIFERLSDYRDTPDGVTFDLPFDNRKIACRLMKERGGYVLHYDGGTYDVVFKSVEDLILKINNGSVQERLMRAYIMNKNSYRAYEGKAAEIDGKTREIQMPLRPIHLELNWKYPDPDVWLWVHPYGKLTYQIRRKNVTLHGEADNEGITKEEKKNVRHGSSGSLDEFLRVIVPHLKEWAEGEEHTAGETIKTKKERAFSAISTPFSFMKPAVEEQIGRVINHEIYDNEVASFSLDWGGGNSLKKKDNPTVHISTNDRGGYTCWIDYRNMGRNETEFEGDSLQDVFNFLEKMRKNPEAVRKTTGGVSTSTEKSRGQSPTGQTSKREKTSDGPEKKETAVDPITLAWGSGKEVENPFAKTAEGTKFRLTKLTTFRRYAPAHDDGSDGIPSGNFPAETEVTLNNPSNNRAKEIIWKNANGKEIILTYIPIIGKDGKFYWIAAQRVEEIEGKSEKAEVVLEKEKTKEDVISKAWKDGKQVASPIPEKDFGKKFRIKEPVQIRYAATDEKDKIHNGEIVGNIPADRIVTLNEPEKNQAWQVNWTVDGKPKIGTFIPVITAEKKNHYYVSASRLEVVDSTASP